MRRALKDLKIILLANLWTLPVFAALVGALFYFVAPPPPMSARMATGFAGGSYRQFAEQLKTALAKQGFELAEDAKRYYQDGLPLLQRHLPFRIASLADRYIILLIPLLMVLFPLSKAIGPIYQWCIRARIYRWYKYLREIDRTLNADTPAERLQDEIGRLEQLEVQLAKVEVPLSYSNELYPEKGTDLFNGALTNRKNKSVPFFEFNAKESQEKGGIYLMTLSPTEKINQPPFPCKTRRPQKNQSIKNKEMKQAIENHPNTCLTHEGQSLSKVNPPPNTILSPRKNE